MKTLNRFLIIGNDKRFEYIGRWLLEQKNAVYWYHPDSYDPIDGICYVNDVLPTDYALLPVPMRVIEKQFKCDCDTMINKLHKDTMIFGGLIPTQLQLKLQQRCFDYGRTGEFTEQNAVPTAEGAIEIAMQHTPFMLENAKVCVVGFGKIGKVLTQKLIGLSCDVTATARKENDLKHIRSLGIKAVETKDLYLQKPFQIIFNTVPEVVIDRLVLLSQNTNTLIIDLASNPGGVDVKTAKENNISVIHALSLPSRHCPQTAAKIIYDIIMKQIKKEETL